MGELPSVALSIQQPWSWLIVNGFKNIENRDWKTKFRGPVLIHAGKKLDEDAAMELSDGRHPVTGDVLLTGFPSTTSRGGIVGVAEIIDCIEHSHSPWFVGRYGFVLANARALPFMPLKGALSFFKAEYITP